MPRNGTPFDQALRRRSSDPAEIAAKNAAYREAHKAELPARTEVRS